MAPETGHVLEAAGLENRHFDPELAEHLFDDGAQVDHADGANEGGAGCHDGTGSAGDVVASRRPEPPDVGDHRFALGDAADVFVQQVTGGGGAAGRVNIQHQGANLAVAGDPFQQAGIVGFADGRADDAVHLNNCDSWPALEQWHSGSILRACALSGLAV